jgi:16S rRNA G966 N2-methylase RsmD
LQFAAVTNAFILSLTQPEIQKFIFENEHIDESAFLLKHKTFQDIPAHIITNQIAGRRKARTKLPLFFSSKGIIYPPGLNLEQSSSEATALLKSNLLPGDTAVDLTGGFGVDSYFLSKNFKTLHYIERNEELLSIVRHNHKLLDAQNIQHHNITAEDFLRQTSIYFDLIYIDPSRRSEGNKKVFKFSECEPNVVKLQPDILEKTNSLLVKVSPLLDIQQGLKEVKFIKEVIIVSVENECKEILFLSQKNFSDTTLIKTVNLSRRGNEYFDFNFQEELNQEVTYHSPMSFLYEPNASILKAGAFKSIANKFHLKKIHPNTHLYTADNIIENFPGRIFRILGEARFNNKVLQKFFPGGKANITTRNFPLSPEEIRKKTKLKDGGERYLIAFSGKQKKYTVAADRVNPKLL